MSETQITVDRKMLMGAVTKVKPVTLNRKDLPALAMVRLVPRGRRLTIEATDLDSRRSVTVPAQAEGAPVLVHPKTLAAFLRGSSHPEVVLTANGDTVDVALNGTRASIPLTSDDDWPKEAEAWESGEVIPLAPHLVEAIRRVSVAASPDDSRPILTGLSFDQCTLVATDSYRLAWMGPFGPFPKMLVQADPLVAAIKVAGKYPTMVVGPKSVLVCGTDAASTVPRIEGDFPKWRSLVPSSMTMPYRVTFQRDAMAAALKRCSAFLGAESDMPTPVRLAVDADGVVLTAIPPRRGEWGETIAGSGKLPDDGPLAVNPDFLREGVEACFGPDVTLHATDGLKQVRLSDGSHFSYLLMPVRIL